MAQSEEEQKTGDKEKQEKEARDQAANVKAAVPKFPKVPKRRPAWPARPRPQKEKVVKKAQKESTEKKGRFKLKEIEGQEPDKKLEKANNSKNDKRTDKQKAQDDDKEKNRLGAEYTEKFTGMESGIASTVRGATSRGLKDLGFNAGARMMQQGPERPYERKAAKRGLKEWQQMQRAAIRGGRANKPLEDPRDRERQERAEQRKEAKRQRELEARRKRRRRGKSVREYSDSASLPSHDREFENGFFDNAKKDNKDGRNEPRDRSKNRGIENSKFLSIMRERKNKNKQKENSDKATTKQTIPTKQATPGKQQKQDSAKKAFMAQQSRETHQRSKRDDDIDSRMR
ncbi:MAG: hypothetical protein K2W95_14225 [Candidatus Obscuribacterales bacterium]|nr:hypothetical protein [Candidatus Obscuribacterales bacterium]